MNTLGDLTEDIRTYGTEIERWWELVTERSADDLALLLDAVRQCRAELASFATEAEKVLLSEMGERSIEVMGLGLVEAKKSIRRTGWKHDELIAAVVARVADEPGVFFNVEDGALLPFATIGHNVAARLRACIGFGAGKVTGLKAIGLQPDEFCTQDDGAWSVKLPGRDVV